jgi:hypothetical protein
LRATCAMVLPFHSIAMTIAGLARFPVHASCNDAPFR